MKPSVILLNKDGTKCRVVFLDVVRHLINSYNDSPRSSMIYHAKYTAPEILMHERPIPYKSDMYSLGLILVYMLTKEIPDLSDIESGDFNIPEEYS